MGGGRDGGGVKPVTAVQVCVSKETMGQLPAVVVVKKKKKDNLLEIRTSRDVFVWTKPDVLDELWTSSAVFMVIKLGILGQNMNFDLNQVGFFDITLPQDENECEVKF